MGSSVPDIRVAACKEGKSGQSLALCPGNLQPKDLPLLHHGPRYLHKAAVKQVPLLGSAWLCPCDWPLSLRGFSHLDPILGEERRFRGGEGGLRPNKPSTSCHL